MKIANWTETYKKGTDLEDWKRKRVEAESLIGETHLQQYEESKYAVLAKELLQEFVVGNHRDHVITSLHASILAMVIDQECLHV